MTLHLCRACGRVSRRCRGSSSHSWERGRTSGFGLITGWDTVDLIGCSLVSTLYPRISGFWCSRLGMTLGSRPYPEALPDQQVAELISLQELLTHHRLSEAVQDPWIWSGLSFTTRAAYRLLRDQENPEDPLILQRCRLVWKRRLPLKIKVFAWLLLRRRLMTRSMLQRIVLNVLAECPLCARAVEDCQHLFFACPLAQTVWQATGVGRLVVTLEEAFWWSLGGGTFRREVE